MWCRNIKICFSYFTIIFEGLIKISVHILHFETENPSSLDDLIVISGPEKLTDHIKTWHLHSRAMSQKIFIKFSDF